MVCDNVDATTYVYWSSDEESDKRPREAPVEFVETPIHSKRAKSAPGSASKLKMLCGITPSAQEVQEELEHFGLDDAPDEEDEQEEAEDTLVVGAAHALAEAIAKPPAFSGWLRHDDVKKWFPDIKNGWKAVGPFALFFYMMPQHEPGKLSVSSLAGPLGLEWDTTHRCFKDMENVYIVACGYKKQDGGDANSFLVFVGPRAEAVERMVPLLQKEERPRELQSLMEHVPLGRRGVRVVFDIEKYIAALLQHLTRELETQWFEQIRKRLRDLFNDILPADHKLPHRKKLVDACNIAVTRATRVLEDGRQKLSYHIVFPDIYVETWGLMGDIAEYLSNVMIAEAYETDDKGEVKCDNTWLANDKAGCKECCIDKSIYSKNRCMRYVGQRKFGGGKDTTLEPLTFKDEWDKHMVVPDEATVKTGFIITRDLLVQSWAGFGVASRAKITRPVVAAGQELHQELVDCACAVLGFEGKGDPHHWKWSTRTQEPGFVRIETRKTCTVNLEDVHKKEWNGSLLFDLHTWEVKRNCWCKPNVFIPVETGYAKALQSKAKTIKKRNTGAETYEEHLRAMKHIVAGIHGRIEDNLLDAEVASEVNSMLRLEESVTWHKCRIDAVTCVLLSNHDAMKEVRIDLESVYAYDHEGEQVDVRGIIKKPLISLFFGNEFVLPELKGLAGSQVIHRYMSMILPRMSLAKRVKDERVFRRDPDNQYIMTDTGMTMWVFCQDLLRKAPAYIKMEYEKNLGVANACADIIMKLEFLVPPVRTRACLQFANGVYDIPKEAVDPKELPKYFRTWEDLKKANEPLFLPRYKTEETWVPEMFTDKKYCQSYYTVINNHVAKDSVEEKVFVGMLGRAQCHKQQMEEGTMDQLQCMLVVYGKSGTGKSLVMTLIGESNNPGILGPHIVPISGSATGKGGVGSLARFVEGDPDVAISKEMPEEEHHELYNETALSPTAVKNIIAGEAINITIKHKSDHETGLVTCPLIVAMQGARMGLEYKLFKHADIYALIRRLIRLKFGNKVTNKDPAIPGQIVAERGGMAMRTLDEYMRMRQKYKSAEEIPFVQEEIKRGIRELHPFGRFLGYSERMREGVRIVRCKGKHVTKNEFLEAFKKYAAGGDEHIDYKKALAFIKPMKDKDSTDKFLDEADVFGLYGFEVVYEDNQKLCKTCLKSIQGVSKEVIKTNCNEEGHEQSNTSVHAGYILNATIVKPEPKDTT